MVFIASRWVSLLSKLDQSTFEIVVSNTPLISIDLIVRNSKSHVLVGRRINAPAQQCYFVPGGRVLKNELLDQAFGRITEDELGVPLARKKSIFLGVYEHLYHDSSFSSEISTHYIVLGFEVFFEDLKLNNIQHDEFKWLSEDELLASPDVHQNTKNYFYKV